MLEWLIEEGRLFIFQPGPSPEPYPRGMVKAVVKHFGISHAQANKDLSWLTWGD